MAWTWPLAATDQLLRSPLRRASCIKGIERIEGIDCIEGIERTEGIKGIECTAGPIRREVAPVCD